MRSRKPILILGLFGIVVVVPALAQPLPPSNYPPPCEEAKVTRSDRDRAHTVFLSGKQFLEESNYDKAISYFKDAYAIDCSVHGMLPIIATAYERKGDKREAVRALEEYLKRAPTAPDHDVIERRIKNLKDQIAQEPPAPTQSVGTTATPSSSVAPLPGPAPTEASTGAATSTVSTTPPVTPESRHSAAPWVFVGIGGAAVAGGVVLLAVGAGDVSSAESACPSRKGCEKSVTDQGNTGRMLEPLGFVVGGVGVAAVVGGLVWHFMEKPSDAPTQGAVRVLPLAAPGYAGVSFDGAF